ncbi:MAG: hypothetical protein II674_03480, partial [Prevotella sp.]|nr:hypothetical protein [Prevotella sp.]
MNRQTIITILLALVAMLGQAQTKVWNKIVTGYANVPFMSITKVSIYDDRTEVFFRLEVPEQAAGDSLPIAAKPTLRVGGKEYAVKGATVISLSEPYKIPADGKVDFSLIFEPIPANTWMIDVAEPDTWFFANVHDAENLPIGIADTYWRNEATGDWLIGFTPKNVIYGNRVHDIVSQTEKKDAYALTLDNGINVKVSKMKKGLRTIAIGNDKPVSCSPITGTALPDYPTKDTRKGFVDNGYRAGDSVTIIGWLKDMPQEVWQRKGREFQVGLENILSTENEQGSAYALMDSLGHFTLKMPLLNTSQAFLDWGRSSKSTVLEPGKTYFFLNDFKTGQTLWMGDDVRVQNELLAHPHSWDYAEFDRSSRDLDPMTYLAQADSMRKTQINELEQWVTNHPNLSQRYQDYVAGYYQNLLGESMTQASYQFPNYEMPQEYMEFLGKECWQKAIKPYTLYRDFIPFMRDYLREVMRKRAWRVNWNLYDYNDVIASNDEELSLLNRWKDWWIETTAKVEAAPTPEEKQKIADKLNADNADMIAEVDKILNSPRCQKVRNGIGLIIRMKQEAFALDSLGADQDFKDIWLTRLVNGEIGYTHMSLSPMVIDTLKALVTNPVGIAMIEKQSNYYLAIENREFDKLVLKSSDNLKDLSEGEALLKKILEPYKGKFVLLDVWGTWCGPCREALSHSTEEYARLKDYDIQYLYLANDSPQTAWENVIKE